MELSKYSPDDSDTETNITNGRKKSKKISKREFCLINFDEFSSSTSLHGVQYLGRGKGSTIEKIWWFIMLVASVTICSFFIKKVWDKWNDTPVIVSFSETATSIRNIPFPAITICPQQKFDLDKFNMNDRTMLVLQDGWDNISEKMKFEIQYAELFCHRVKKIIDFRGEKFANESAIDFLKNVSTNLEASNCEWKRNEISFEDQFTYTTTSEGICRTFNAIDSTELFRENAFQFNEYPIENRRLTNGWVLETGYPKNLSPFDAYPRISTSPNMDAGLIVDLFKNRTIIDTNCDTFSPGFKISVHSPAELPNLNLEYFTASVNQKLTIIIKPVMITTSPELIDYKPERRKCYLTNERMLKYFKIYTVKNCELECLSNYTYELCGCVQFWMPRESNMPICLSGKSFCTQEAITDIEMLGTYHENDETFGINDIDDDLINILMNCKCMLSCTSITYETEITQNPINDAELIKQVFEDEIVQQYSEIGETFMRFSFKEAQFIPSRRSELYGVSDFLANCGGIMGLFMGFSFLSAVEVFYFIIIRPILNMRNKNK